MVVTGHTGFKGAWLSRWLLRLGADVTGLALAPQPPPAAFAVLAPWPDRLRHLLVDVRDGAAVAAAVRQAAPDIVMHLAAEAIVRRSHLDPAATYATNVVGTVNVLAAVAALDPAPATLVVTSDKVYDPRGPGAERPHVETDPLGGTDPYSASKACAELAVSAWRGEGPGRRVATARAGNVLGGGDTGADRLVPDVLRSWDAGEPVGVRNRGSVRPWQHVLDVLAGYLLLADTLVDGSPPPVVNFGPDAATTVEQLVDRLHHHLGSGSWSDAPEPAAPAERDVLRLDASLAAQALGWRPKLDLDEALRWTAEWHLAWRSGRAAATSDNQLARYEARWA